MRTRLAILPGALHSQELARFVSHNKGFKDMVLKQLFGKKSESAKTGTQVPAHSETTKSTVQENHAPQAHLQSSELEAGGATEPAPAVYLEQGMIENARSDTAETRRKVYQELLFSDLLLSLAEPEGDGKTVEPVGKDPNNLSVAILTNSGGTQFAAAFTSAAAARRWRTEGGQYVSVRGQDIFKLLEPSPAEVIVINAGSAPFIILSKIEYRQLAMGIVPQGGPSPVQAAAGTAPSSGQSQGAPGADGQMQVAFPPDVFTDLQKTHAHSILNSHPSIEAAVVGAILPPNAGENGWVRTVFLRVTSMESENTELMQQFCAEVRNSIVDNQEIFKDITFEVGVMPDPSFWVSMHQNNIVLFDRNPPAIPKGEGSEAVSSVST